MEINKLIGNTPIVKITIKYNNKIQNIYAKLEYYNFTGSIKDRLVKYIIEKSYEDGKLKKGMPIVEVSSGNTGISFAALGALYKHPVHIFIPDWVSKERVSLIKLYGAHVHFITHEDGGFKNAILKADKLAKEINGFRPNQFSNPLNVEAHYKGIGTEISYEVPNIDAFVSGYGTGGTLIGIAKKLKETKKQIKIIAMEPKNMSFLSNEPCIGNHQIEGIGDEFLPDLINTDLIDQVITITDEEALNMTKRLSSELGLGVGISSGANFLASVLSNEENVATVFSDDIKKYLSTNLVNEIKEKNLESNKIEFINFEII